MPTVVAPKRLRHARNVCNGDHEQGVSSGETPDSEKARALELAKLGHDPSPILGDIAGGGQSEEIDVAVEVHRNAADDGYGDDRRSGISSGETPDSEKARAQELAKLAYDPSPTLKSIAEESDPE